MLISHWSEQISTVIEVTGKTITLQINVATFSNLGLTYHMCYKDDRIYIIIHNLLMEV